MRKVGLAGIAILLVAIVVSGASYIIGQGFEWNLGDVGFIYSLVLTLGFLASIGAGLFGAIKENEEFLIAGGAACIAIAIMNKLFTNLLYSWGFLDVIFLLAGVLMVIDRFHVKRIKETKKLEPEIEPEQLLEKLDKLESEAASAEPEVAIQLEKEMFDLKNRLWLEAKTTPELRSQLKFRLYSNPIVRRIVQRLVDSELDIIEPAIEMGGTPIYPKLVNVEGVSQKEVQSTLNNLVQSNILVKDLYEKLVACPHCHQPSKVFIRNKCPKCGSHKVHMDRIMEHIKCGAINRYEEYQQPGGAKCPKCKRRIEAELELNPVGVAFDCETCKSGFSDPIQAFYCRSCDAEFELKSCELVNTYSYSLNDEVKTEAKETITVFTVADTLERLGYKVNVPGLIKGKSGVSHQFSLTYAKKNKTTAVDIAMAEKKVDMGKALSSYAKYMDSPATERLLIAIPTLEPEAKEFLTANRIKFVEGETASEINVKVKQLITKK